MIISLNQLECKCCGYKWFPRQPEVLLCPNCKNPRWERGKVRKPYIYKNKKEKSNA